MSLNQNHSFIFISGFLKNLKIIFSVFFEKNDYFKNFHSKASHLMKNSIGFLKSNF